MDSAVTATGLLGPSRSGKTTLMRAVVGVQVVRSGEVTVLGEPAGSPALRGLVGYVTQAPSVYDDLTVRENARYFAALYGLGAREADAAVTDVGLAGAGGRLVRDLSGGQKSRASLACALVAAPEVLVLDEPTVGLDPALRVELWKRWPAPGRRCSSPATFPPPPACLSAAAGRPTGRRPGNPDTREAVLAAARAAFAERGYDGGPRRGRASRRGWPSSGPRSVTSGR